MRVWVTRAAPEAEATAARLRVLGHSPLTAPVLEVRADADAVLDLGGVDALAFTSRNGVRAFANLNDRRDLAVFVVGDSTAEAAGQAGFASVTSAGGDLADLSRLIAQARPGVVLHAAAREPAAMLRPEGVTVRTVAVYAAIDLDLPSAAAAALAAEPPELDAILVHSPRAARRLADYADLEKSASALQAFCISDAAAEPLIRLNFAKVAVAPLPNEQSLLNLLAPG
jgi:uroporphyrinogen-III synthase